MNFQAVFFICPCLESIPSRYIISVCVFLSFQARRHFLLGIKKGRREENSPQLPATHCHPCEADKAKARIKKLIAEEATERSVGTCTVASGLSCFTIYGKKAGMSAPVKLALRPWHFCLEQQQQRCASLLCQRLGRPPVYRPLFTLASSDADASLSKKLRLVGWRWQPLQDSRCHPVD